MHRSFPKIPFLVPFVLFSCLLVIQSCRERDKYPALGTNLASPVDIAVSNDGNYFYTLNADYDRTYNAGSILIMDKDGNKLKALPLPRMGRSLNVVGSIMIATIDYTDQSANAQPYVQIYDLTDPANPVLKYSVTLDCSPIASSMTKGYSYFAISCTNGSIYLGQFGADLSQTQIQKVRQFAQIYRALYLDPKRNLLLGFPDQADKPTVGDQELLDANSYSPVGALISPNPNEIPDQYEQTIRAWSDLSQRQTFQFFVYDIAAEATNAPDCAVSSLNPTCNFPFRVAADPIPQGELRWLYFNLTDYNGAPDQSTYFNNPSYKYYRTNFFVARPDPDDPDVFYLSQRGAPNISPNSNQVIRVHIIGDLHATYNSQTNVSTFNNTTPNELTFQRIYGFKGAEASKYAYPGDFRVVTINNQKTVIVNNFRDLVNWVRTDAVGSYWIGAQVIDNATWFGQLNGQLSPTDDIRTYYQVAVNSSGRGASCSFYGDQIIFFDVSPGVGINIVTQVR